MRFVRCGFFIGGTVVAGLALLLMGWTGGLAMQATPAVGLDARGATADELFPAAVYQGTCADVDASPRFRLDELVVGLPGDVGATSAAGQLQGHPTAIPVAMSVTTIDVSLDELLDTAHAIAVRATGQTGPGGNPPGGIERAGGTMVVGTPVVGTVVPGDAVGNERVIACGTVGGMRLGDNLALGLQEWNDAGYVGVASLHANDDGTTTVTVFVAQDLSGS